MGTTVWVDDEVRQELRRMQESLRTNSVNDTLKIILTEGERTARALFVRHADAIRAILDRHGLDELVAFGSRARGDHRPDSDLDLAVIRVDKSNPLAILAAENDLEELFGIPVGIVERPNPKLDGIIDREGIPFGA